MQLLKESVDWNYFDKFDNIVGEYMPVRGEGETMASQIVTAANKLIYKWYNDGDVYDNTHYLEGWANDLSSYANWLYKYIEPTRNILNDISNAKNDAEYEDILKALAEKVLNKEFLSIYECETNGSIYSCSGPFKFKYHDDDFDEDDEF